MNKKHNTSWECNTSVHHNFHTLICCLILVIIDRNREYGKDKSEVEIGDSKITAIFNFFCTLYCFLRFLLGLASDCPFFQHICYGTTSSIGQGQKILCN